jgi:hypothetical protein
MTQVALDLMKHDEIVFSRHEIEGAFAIEDERELLFMQHCHTFFDEWPQDHPAKDWWHLDPVTQHIVTQCRKYGITIHWSAQHWKYMDPFIRRNTDFVWRHEALWPNANTGKSRIGWHHMTKIAAIEAELEHARPTILASKYFRIKKKVYSKYDSFKPIMLTKAKISDEEILAVKNPYSRAKVTLAAREDLPARSVFLKRDEEAADTPPADVEQIRTMESDSKDWTRFDGRMSEPS